MFSACILMSTTILHLVMFFVVHVSTQFASSRPEAVTQVTAHFSNTGYIDLAVPDDAPVECNLQTIRDDATVGDKEYFFTYHPAGFSDELKRPRVIAIARRKPRIAIDRERESRVSQKI